MDNCGYKHIMKVKSDIYLRILSPQWGKPNLAENHLLLYSMLEVGSEGSA